MARLVFDRGELGRRFEKILTWSETEYFSGNLSSGRS
jgi:hypothetical protein